MGSVFGNAFYIFVVICFMVGAGESGTSPAGMWSILLGSIGVWFCIHQFNRIKRNQLVRSAIDAVSAIVDTHARTLAVRKKQLLVPDHYGVVDNTAWSKELARFWSTVVAPSVGPVHSLFFIKHVGLTTRFHKLVDAKTQAYAENYDFDIADPTDYERLCADLLRREGWSARTTKGSGDQGSDVIAERQGVKLVLQCKLYSRPVGNKAVQEAAAARVHEGADFAAVVANSPFTAAARALASTNGINLLHHDALQNWARSLLPE